MSIIGTFIAIFLSGYILETLFNYWRVILYFCMFFIDIFLRKSEEKMLVVSPKIVYLNVLIENAVSVWVWDKKLCIILVLLLLMEPGRPARYEEKYSMRIKNQEDCR